jgi:restriction system protein
MIIDDLVSNVAEVPQKTNYWFVRTDYGKYFDTFVKNEFIGIGWNNISLEELKNKNSEQAIREKLIKSEKFDPNKPSTKGKVTTIVNKLNHFINLKKGDIIIIPSRNSSRYAFGTIVSSQTDIDIEKSFNCEFYKRKKVKWLAVKNIQQLDPNFYRIKISRHTISKLEGYSVYIDNVTNTLYRKNDYTHFVLDITTTKDVNVNSLISLIENMQFLINKINEHYSLGEAIDKNSIRLNLQSPGKIEFKLLIGKSLVTLATIMSLTCCDNDSHTDNHDLHSFIQVHSDTLAEIKKSMNELEVDKEKINNFQYGN